MTKKESTFVCVVFNVSAQKMCSINIRLIQCIVINGEQSVKMPKKVITLKFNNCHKQLQVPFVIYSDFESLNQIMIKVMQKNINNTKIVLMAILKWFAVMMINSLKKCNITVLKMLFINSWTRCYMK